MLTMFRTILHFIIILVRVIHIVYIAIYNFRIINCISHLLYYLMCVTDEFYEKQSNFFGVKHLFSPYAVFANILEKLHRRGILMIIYLGRGVQSIYG